MQVTASRIDARVVFSIVLSLALAVACVLPSYAHAGVMRDSNNLLPLEFEYFYGANEYRQVAKVNNDFHLRLEPGTYTFSADINKESTVAILIDGVWNYFSGDVCTFTLPENYNYFYIYYVFDSEDEAKSAVISKPMINAGSTTRRESVQNWRKSGRMPDRSRTCSPYGS